MSDATQFLRPVKLRRDPLVTVDRLTYKFALAVLVGLACSLLVLPTLIVVLTSFTSSAALRFPPPGLSLQWYRTLFFQSSDIVEAALVSLKVAVLATALATLLAVPAALSISRSQASWAKVADSIFMSPLLLPSIVVALGLLVLVDRLGVGTSIRTLVAGHIVVCFPFILRTTLASLAQIDTRLGESSKSLGAGPFFEFFHVTLPLIRGGVLAGGFIAFMASFDNVAVSLFLADPRSEVLPIRLWNLVENLLDVRAAAASGFLILATVILILVLERLTGLFRYIR